MKKIDEIESEYCREIVMFFCSELYEHTLRKENPKEEFTRMLARQIESRLMATNIVRNYSIIYTDADVRREKRLSGILHGGPTECSDVEVILDRGLGRYMTIDFNRSSSSER